MLGEAPPPYEIPVVQARTSREAETLARQFAQVPRTSRGGAHIPASDLSESSRGPNWRATVERQQASGRPEQLGSRNLFGPNHYMRHPDGHSVGIHGDSPHFHAVDPRGRERIFAYPHEGPSSSGPWSGISRTGRMLGKAAFGIGLVFSGWAVASASPPERGRVISGEVGGTLGGIAAGAALGTMGCPLIGTIAGAIAGGIAGSLAGESAHDWMAGGRTPEVGGVDLSGILLGGAADLVLASSIADLYISDDGHFVFVDGSERETASIGGLDASVVTLHDLLVLIVVVYRGRQPAFSLDLWDPSDADGPFYQKSFYPTLLAGTQVGETLFAVDHLLKQYALGVIASDPTSDRTEPRGRSPLRGYRNEADLHFEGSGQATTEAVRRRVWITCESVELSASETGADPSGGRLLSFGRVKFGCRSKRVRRDPSSPSGLCDDEDDEVGGGEEDSSARFAETFEGLLDRPDLYEAEPQFARLRELAKLTALATWMRDSGIRVDLDRIVSLLIAWGDPIGRTLGAPEGPQASSCPEAERACSDKIPRLSATYSRTSSNASSRVVSTLNLSGGVNLGSRATVKSAIDPRTLAERTKVLRGFVDGGTGGDPFRGMVDPCPDASVPPKAVGGHRYPATCVPMLHVSGDLRTAPLLVVADDLLRTADSDPEASLGAIEVLRHALEADPDNPRTYVALADACERRALHREALFAMGMVGTLDPVGASSCVERIERLSLDLLVASCEDQGLTEVGRAHGFPLFVPSDWDRFTVAGVSDASALFMCSLTSTVLPETFCETLTWTVADDPGVRSFDPEGGQRMLRRFLLTESVATEHTELEAFGLQDARLVAYSLGSRSDGPFALTLCFAARLNARDIVWSQVWLSPSAESGSVVVASIAAHAAGAEGARRLAAEISARCLSEATEQPSVRRTSFPSGSWSCRYCTLANPPSDHRCRACGSPASTGARRTEAQGSSEACEGDATVWTCGVCTLSNHEPSDICEMCLQPRASSVVPIIVPEDRWGCRSCTFLNRAEVSCCEVCSLPK